jgi:hypothetical protein
MLLEKYRSKIENLSENYLAHYLVMPQVKLAINVVRNVLEYESGICQKTIKQIM